MRSRLVAGNWKMYRTLPEARELARSLREAVGQHAARGEPAVVVCPPFPALGAVAEELAGSSIAVGGQNLHWEREGAFTGEVSGAMLRAAGARFVIVGHSERRRLFGETDEWVTRKVKAALSAGLQPIVCLGETLEERERGATAEVVGRQFLALAGLGAEDWSRVVLAYEPVWAIGTGRTATPDMAAEVHAALRRLVRERVGEGAAESLRILYGGSVNSDNAPGLFGQEDIDGALVGGASLSVDSFRRIVESAAAQAMPGCRAEGRT